MNKLLVALLVSTPLAMALPAAAKFQAYGAFTPAAETSDEDKDKSKGDDEKKEFKVSDEDKDKSKGDEEKKEFQVSDDNDQDKSKGDEEKKEFQA